MANVNSLLSTPRTKNKRKQRTVKNAYVDIDSVTAEPGYKYSEWIKIAKQKLKVQFNKQLTNIS